MKFDTIQFEIEETFTTRLLGSAPADKEVYDNYIAGKKAESEERKRKFGVRSHLPVTENVGTAEEESATLPKNPTDVAVLPGSPAELDEVNESSGITVFHNDLREVTESGENGKGLFLYDYQVAGFYKEAAEVLQEIHGIAAVRSKLDNLMMVRPRRVYIEDQAGEVLTKADGILQRPLRAKTMQGPRVSLAASQLIDQNRKIRYVLDFLPYVMSGRGKREDKKAVDLLGFVQLLVSYAERKGRGQWRGGGNGRFIAKIRPISPGVGTPLVDSVGVKV